MVRIPSKRLAGDIRVSYAFKKPTSSKESPASNLDHFLVPMDTILLNLFMANGSGSQAVECEEINAEFRVRCYQGNQSHFSSVL